MLDYLQQFLRPPEHDDPSELLKAQILHSVLIGTLALIVVFLAVRTALESEGYHVLSAAGGVEALALEARHAGPIHLLLTDVIMPGMTGTDLTQNLIARRPGLKVLYASGYTDNMLAKAGGLTPDAACLAKPFTPDVVALRVREILGPPLNE